MRQKTPKSVAGYIAVSPTSTKVKLQQLRSLIRETVPDAEEMISYAMPAYKLRGKPLVYFAAFAHHIGFYPTSSPITKFKNSLAGFTHAKGSVQFPLDKPIPTALVKKMVKYRAKEILES